jgi:hypothetical protein
MQDFIEELRKQVGSDGKVEDYLMSVLKEIFE